MKSNKKEEVPTSQNKGTNLQTAANTGISTAEKEKSFDNSVEHDDDDDDLDNGTHEDKPTNLFEGSEFLDDLNTGQKAAPLKNPAKLEDHNGEETKSQREKRKRN